MHNFEDEVARRRAARRAKEKEAELTGERAEEEQQQFTWSDTFAMIIAAYQVLMPMVLAMAAVMVLAFFLFKWIFS